MIAIFLVLGLFVSLLFGQTTSIPIPPNSSGITIRSGNVTVDLNGFSIEGVPGSLHGIYVDAGSPTAQLNDIRIHNGMVRAWDRNGVLADDASNLVLEDLIVEDTGLTGIEAQGADFGRLSNVISRWGGLRTPGSTAHGIAVGFNFVLTGCGARSNTGDGIVADNSLIAHCLANNNQGVGIHANESSVSFCTAKGNPVANIQGSGYVLDMSRR